MLVPCVILFATPKPYVFTEVNLPLWRLWIWHSAVHHRVDTLRQTSIQVLYSPTANNDLGDNQAPHRNLTLKENLECIWSEFKMIEFSICVTLSKSIVFGWLRCQLCININIIYTAYAQILWSFDCKKYLKKINWSRITGFLKNLHSHVREVSA